MNELSLLFTLATIHVVGLMSPGPDFALVVQTTSRSGRRAGLAVAIGLSCGILLHTILSLTGISYLIQQHAILDILITLLGSSYLLYLGLGALHATWQHFRQPKTNAERVELTLTATRFRAAFLRGFSTNILNPKALVFFISLLSALVPATASYGFKFSLIATFFILSWLWFSMLAWLLSTATMQRKMMQAAPYIDALCGILFTSIATGILLNLML